MTRNRVDLKEKAVSALVLDIEHLAITGRAFKGPFYVFLLMIRENFFVLTPVISPGHVKINGKLKNFFLLLCS